jgi:hypothetical protein
LYTSKASNVRRAGGLKGRRSVGVGVLVTTVWLASARVAWTQEETTPAKSGGSDAANPVVVGPPSPTPPPTGPSPTELALKAQQARLEEMAAEQARLRDELQMMSEILNAERAEEVIGLRDKADKAEAVLKKPPVFTSKGGVGITGFIQADWNILRQSSEDQVNPSTLQPINDERFLIRRARLRTTLDKTYVAGALEFDGNTVNGSTARIVGAEASVKLPGEEGAPLPLLMATIGLFKIPFGYELLQSDRDRLFMERSTAEQALFPGEYDVGARLSGGWRFVRYMVALQNGDPLGEKAFPGRDPNSAKDFSGRIGVDTPVTDTISIAAGFSGLEGKGFHRGNPATKPTIQWSDRNEDGAFQTNELVTSPGLAATPSANFTRFAYGADLELSVGIPGLGKAQAYGEFYMAKNLDRNKVIADPLGPVGRDYRELGWYVAGLLDLGELVTVGARWDTYNPDMDSTDPVRVLVPTDLSFSTLALAAEVHNANGRLVLEYDHNNNKSGRDSTGLPATLKDDSVILRGQVSF